VRPVVVMLGARIQSKRGGGLRFRGSYGKEGIGGGEMWCQRQWRGGRHPNLGGGDGDP
jgi:hypothetical protein